ncbi:MAG: DUF1549 domain-containing protein, partial [Planctomycetaceae bacterium]|nr:DUF1549 domain-containing protein [Planctomycetaceae bacterium]
MIRSLTPRMKCVTVALLSTLASATLARADEPAKPISYYHQIRPIFQANCQGCHQAAKAGGQYVMTDFAKLIHGGDGGEAVVPGKPEEGTLLDNIIPVDGKAQMPKGKAPLLEAEIDLIRNWIAAGAIDDTPADAKIVFDLEHPPKYTIKPLVTSLDFSPDGKLLAVTGYSEVLLHDATKLGQPDSLVARLIGQSPRIETVKFSPDGSKLAASGGIPGQLGEVQVWDVASKELKLSHTVGFDTIFGVNWSGDGNFLAFGCGDKTLRAINAATGEQVLFQNTHEDRVLDTVFSTDDSHVVSVSVDRTVKLTEKATQRFIDNVTSITPGALKGGINAIARHPQSDVVLVGGADGEPKLYIIYRRTKRVIGDDANLMRKFPPIPGRINDVAITPDGKAAVAVSSLDGQGYLKIYSLDVNPEIPDEIKAIQAKRVANQSADEKKKLEDFVSREVKDIGDLTLPTNLYTVAFDPNGSRLATAGSDGMIRLLNAADAKVLAEFSPVPMEAGSEDVAAAKPFVPLPRKPVTVETEVLPENAEVQELTVSPTEWTIGKAYDTVQYLVTAKFSNGQTRDVTRLAKATLASPIAALAPNGLCSALADGTTTVTFELAGKSAQSTLHVQALAAGYHPDFIRDVAPVISKLGCNAGTCHGANKGKGSLKLSLRGNDPIFDLAIYTDELNCRRVNFAYPDQSMILLKPSANLPHEGGRLFTQGEADYDVIRQWIAEGAKLNSQSPRVTSIKLEPENPVVEDGDLLQQFRIVATYADGSVRDVTAESTIESSDQEVAKADSRGLVSTFRRGETAILGRYEGNFVVTTLAVMGDRTGFVWQDPPTYNFIDELVAAKWKRTKTQPSDLCTDVEFVRRAYLDLTGLPPTADEVRGFLSDARESRVKREALVDLLVGNVEFIEHWTNKWADLLQVNRKYLGIEGAEAFRDWIRLNVGGNAPYDQFAYKILTASGSNRERPQASYFKIHRTPQETMETTTHLFLGLRFNCNKCHDHPFERWTQDQYYETAAYFAQFSLKADPASGIRTVGGSAVESATPLFEEVVDTGAGEVKHDRTGRETPPKFAYTADFANESNLSRRELFARWATSPNNRYFARNFVNRMWAYLMGVGLIEPIDDSRASNPPTNPELLDRLTQDFIDNDFNVQLLMKRICKSRTYQLSVSSNQWNVDDKINYSHYTPKRLPAEVLFDALHLVTGSNPNFPGVPAGTRAARFLDPSVNPAGGFLAQFGRPPRESACECERSSAVQFGPVMALVSGETVGNAVNDPKNAIAELVTKEADDKKVVEEVFMRVLNRPATEVEIKSSLELLTQINTDHEMLKGQLNAAEQKYAPILAEREQQRQAAIAAAQAELMTYEQSIAAREADLDQQHQTRIAAADAKVKAFEAELAVRLLEWEARPNRLPEWQTLDPIELAADNGTKLTKQEDLSVLAEGPVGKGTYKIKAVTALTGITAVRLEVLPDDRLPQKGPGRARDGNFVLTELELASGPKADPAQSLPVALDLAQADFNQGSYDVVTAIDGQQLPNSNGWAIAGGIGKPHVAIFQPATAPAANGESLLAFTFHHQFQDGNYNIGKFRLSVTNSPGPFPVSAIPDATQAILNKKREDRTDEEKQKLLAYFREI